MSEKLSTKPNIYIIHKKFNHFTDVIGSVFVVTIQRVTGEIAFISANFDAGVSYDEVALENLGRLNVQQLIEYNTALLIWKSKHGLAPTYISDMFVPVKSFHNHDTRNAEFCFHTAKKNLMAGTKSFSHSGCHTWNKLPKDSQASSSLRDFKTRAFKFFKKTKVKLFNKIARRLGRSGFA